MKYEKLSPEEIVSHENHIIEKADAVWVDLYGKEETTDIEKLKLYSREGKVQDKFEHDVIEGYFRKQGLWKDGRTTLEERRKQLLLEKTEFGEKIARVRNTKLGDLKEVIKRAEKKKRELEQIPIKLREEYKIDKENILKNLQYELNAFYERAENDIEKEVGEVYDDFINSIKEKQAELVNKAKNELEVLQKHQKNRIRTEVELYSSELDAELQVLDDVENDELKIKQYKDAVKEINLEINGLRGIEGKESIKGIETKIIKTEELFICPYCPTEKQKPFGNKGGLYGHIKVVHGEEKYLEYKNQDNPEEVKQEVVNV